MQVDDRHYSLVADLLASGEVVPFFGAGANLCDRPDEAHVGARPLSHRAASSSPARSRSASRYPDPDDLDLLRVSQYVDAILGEGQLYRYLHAVFDADYPPSSLHRLFARLPALLRENGRPQLLVLTTNYDDLIERAFADAGEQFDVVWYEAKRGPLQGRFLHRPPEGEVVAIERPNKYTGLALEKRPVILKLHGAIDRVDVKRDSYVVTEDSYIDYLVGRRRRRADPVLAARANGGEPLPLPRLLDARLEPAGDPEPDLGRAAARPEVVGGPARAGRRRACARSKRRSGATAATSTCLRPAQGVRRAASVRTVRACSAGVMTDADGGRSDTPKTPYVGLVPYGEADAALFFGRDEEKRIVAGQPARVPADDPLRRRAASARRRCFGPASSTTCASRCSRTPRTGRSAGPVRDLRRSATWRDDPLPRSWRRSRPRSRGARRRKPSKPGSPASRSSTLCAQWTKQVRTVLVVLDQFEDYFLYHGDEDGEGTFAREFPAIVNEPNLRVNFLLSIREDAWAKLDRFEGRIPRAVRELRPRRAPEPSRRAGGDRAPHRRVEPPASAGRAALHARAARSSRRCSTRRWRAGSRSHERGRARAELADGRADRGAVPPARDGTVWRATVEAGARELTNARLEQLGGARSDRREPPARSARRAHAGRAGGRRRPLPLPRHPLEDEDRPPRLGPRRVDGAPRARGHGRAREALPRRERTHPPPGRRRRPTASRSATSSSTTSSPSRSSSGAEGTSRSAHAGRRIRRFARIGGVLLALVAVFAGLGIWALRAAERRRACDGVGDLARALARPREGSCRAHVDRSLLLSLEAYRSSPSADAASTMVAALETARRSGAAAILRGDPGGIRAVAFSPDGRTLASADFTGAIQLWDVQDAHTARRAASRAHERQIWGLAFSPDGRTLASASHDGTVKLWDVRTHALVGRGSSRQQGRDVERRLQP